MLLLLDTLLSLVLLPFVVRADRSLREWRGIPAAPPPPAEAAPLVTVLVPARNEERSIERCLRSLLAQDYPRNRLRVVAIDDRSTDATPAILARLASEDDRLTILHGSPLPPGWLGKCWALEQAARHADPASTYLLFVDADTVHEPHMLASSVRFADSEKVDLLSLGPGQILGTPAERLLLPTIFGVVMSFGGTMDEVNDPRREDAAKAIGQFLLFRADVYRAIGGHESVRNEIVEDFALARRVKGTGFRLFLADGRQYVRTRMYHSIGEIWEGFSKNAYREVQRYPGGAFGALLALLVLVFGPYLLAGVGLRRVRRGGSWSARLLLVQAVVQILAGLHLGRLASTALGLPARYGLAEPLSAAFLAGILANSTWRTRTGKGVRWKGRTY